MNKVKCMEAVSILCTRIFPKAMTSLFVLYRTVMVFLDYIDKGKVKFSDPNMEANIAALRVACTKVFDSGMESLVNSKVVKKFMEKCDEEVKDTYK